MRTARYVSKLVDNIERNYSTKTAVSELLSPSNFKVINSHMQEGSGKYFDVFEDDMAFAFTLVTPAVDDDGRWFSEVDVLVAKYDKSDRFVILDLLQKEHLPRLTRFQNGGELRNPLPEVEL